MLKFKKEEIEMEVSLKKRIEFICDFAKVKPKFINGNVIKIDNLVKQQLINNNQFYLDEKDLNAIDSLIKKKEK